MKFNSCKVAIMGIQGSGKTELAKYLCRQFKHPVWYLMHKDDLIGIPRKTSIVKAQTMKIEELNEICKSCIELGKKKIIDCLVIDEADMFLRQSITLPHDINDLVINHRHYNLTVIFLTRRPQDIPTKIIESCEHVFVFGQPNSDNIFRKMNSLDVELPPLIAKCTRKNHYFVHKKLGEKPTLMKPIKIERGSKKHEATSKKDTSNNEVKMQKGN